MKTWAEFETEAPGIARLGRKLLRMNGKAMLATVRSDGAPRMHPICPVIAGGGLYAVIIMRTPKYQDLRRDARYVLHTLPGPGDAEFCVEGMARQLGEQEIRALPTLADGFQVPAGDAAFELMISAAFGTLYRKGREGLAIPSCRPWRDRVSA